MKGAEDEDYDGDKKKRKIDKNPNSTYVTNRAGEEDGKKFWCV